MFLIALTLLSACRPAVAEPPIDPTDPTTDSAPSRPTVATATGSTGDTGDVPTFDCATVPAKAAPAVQLTAPHGYNDVVFDPDGAMIGHDGNGLVKAIGPDTFEPFVPGLQTVYKMDQLPDGRTVAALASGGVTVVTADGSSSAVAPDVRGYGLAVGPDGLVYVASNYTSSVGVGIVRIDADTGVVDPWLTLTDTPPRAIDFSRDGDVLYFGTLSGGGVFKVEVDANVDPIGDPQLLTMVPTGWHDTLEVDACGNVYVGSVFCSCIYRIDSALAVTTVMDWQTQQYGHGFEWGAPAGGWNELAAYVTHPYVGERVTEVVLGVPSRRWVGEVVGGSTL